MAKTALKIKGLKGLAVALDPTRFDKALRTNMRRATALNGKLAERSMRKVIQAGVVTPGNAALTEGIKGDSKVLVDDSTLFGSITSRAVSDTEAFAGVLRTSAEFNVAVAVHEGMTIAVTSRMRGMFFFLWKASVGEMDPGELTGRAAELFGRFQDWRPLSPETTTITVPARRWAQIAFNDPGLKAQAKKNWDAAIHATLSQVAAAGRSAG